MARRPLSVGTRDFPKYAFVAVLRLPLGGEGRGEPVSFAHFRGLPMSVADPDGQTSLAQKVEQLAAMMQGSKPRSAGEGYVPLAVRSHRPRPLARDEELAFAESDDPRDDSEIPVMPSQPAEAKFMPLAPASLEEAGLSEGEVEALVLKFLLGRGTTSGAEISHQIALPFTIVEQVLHSLKSERLVTFKGSATLHDYLYELTENGVDRARMHARQCTYFGAAPVALDHYVESVVAQSLSGISPTFQDIRRAFDDLWLNEEMLQSVGRAVTFGKGLFLFGSPGNGKTSIAERVTRAYGGSIWIPRAISAWGEIIRLYDPGNHEEIPLTVAKHVAVEEKIDHRWVRIRRPTIVVGGELTMDSLEIRTDKVTGIGEAPLQLKSNCGTLVIDDFGRQRISPAELLNRWIVPLEKRHDYLSLASGRKIQVPFEQFVVFSTNLEPRDLVDEAFLRRIPYKISVGDPTEAEFREVFRQFSDKAGIECSDEAVEHLIRVHYRESGRAMRFCHPRDLLRQVEVFCRFAEQSPRLSVEAIDAAANEYFSAVL